MIRCVRIWTGADDNSLFEEGTIDLSPKKDGGERGNVLSDRAVFASISFRETQPGGTYAPYQAPTRQFVTTLAGTLEFKTVPAAPSESNPATSCALRTPPAAAIAGSWSTTSLGVAPMWS